MPYLQKQLYPIPFTGGLDTKTDPKQVLAGNLLTLQNGVFTNPGSIQKRTGYTAFGTKIEGTNNFIEQSQAINVFNSELLNFDGTNAYSYVAQTGNWQTKGTAISVINTDKQQTRLLNAQQLNPDVSYYGGIEVYAYEDTRNSGSVRYTVIDTTTGNSVVADTNLQASSSQPKCITFFGVHYIFYQEGTILYYQTVNHNNPSLITDQVEVFADGYTTGFPYDISVIGSNIFIAYLSSNTSSGELDVYYLNSNLVLSSRYTIATGLTATTGAFDIGPTALGNSPTVSNATINIVGDSSSNVWISWCEGENIRVAAYTYVMNLLLKNTIVSAALGNRLTGIENPNVAPNVLNLFWEVWNTNSFDYKIQYATITLAGVITTGSNSTIQRSVGLASKAFVINDNVYVNVAYDTSSCTTTGLGDTNQQCTYFTLVYTSDFHVVGKVASQVGGGLRTNTLLSEVPTISTNIVKWANLIKSPQTSEAGVNFSVLGVNSTQMDFENQNKFLSVQFSNNMLVVGGIMQLYDGISFFEQGYHYYPEGITCTPNGTDGELSAGLYAYTALYAWSDNFGQVHRSGPSPIATVAASATNHMTITVPTLRLTDKSSHKGRDDVIIEIYRSQANASGVNAIYYLVTSVLAPLANSVTADTVSFTDLESDAEIADNPLIYTTGGVLPNDAAPAHSLITLFGDRVVIGGMEDPNLLWYSQIRTEIDNFNTTPVEFSADNTIQVDPRGGKITALGLLNQNLIIFKENYIFYIQGSGPDNTGNGTTFPDAQEISTDVGCKNPNSVVITPMGLMFQSDKGIYLLDQSFNLTYIGQQVQGFTGQVNAGAQSTLAPLTISSSTLSPNTNQVIFTSTAGTSLVYDYYVSQWSTYTNQYASDSNIFQELFCFVDSDGVVYQNDPSVFTDNGAPVYLSWTTPWLSFAQLNGFQRVYQLFILGTFRGNHMLNVNVAYDYNDTYVYSTSINANFGITQNWGNTNYWGDVSPWGGTFIPYEFRVDFNQQKCTAIKINISDSQSSPYNEGYAISALTFIVGIMPGAVQLPATSVYGTS